MYLTPDLTGENELYKVDNDQRLIISLNQVVHFDDAIFVDTLQVTAVGTVNRTLVKGADWNYTSDNLDIERMASMKMIDSSFNRQLVKSIVIIKPFVGAEYRINCSYQRLYPEFAKVALYDNGEPLEFTPDVFKYMLELLKKHDYLLSPIADVHSVTSTNPLLLEVDPHKALNENKITNEIHLINVPENVSVIHPIGGAFFEDSVKIIHVETGNTLVKNVNYKIFGLDVAKTKISSNPSGVYRFILFLNEFVGNVKLDYHAYGGDPTITDVRSLDETMSNLIQYIVEAQLLTPNTVSTAPVITLLKNKIQALEEDMRKLATTGRPSYGDLSHGGCLVKRIAANDTEHHWWTIGSLYKVDGSDDVFVADTMKLRIQTHYTKFAFDLVVNANILHAIDKMDLKVLTATYPKGYIPFEDYSELQSIIRPQVRLIWNKNTVNNSGILLQIGMRLKSVAEETIAVEDWSGTESAWKLIPTPVEAIFPEETLITLPNPNHVWDLLNPDSSQVSSLVPFPDGHLLWVGTEALNRPVAGWKNLSLVHLFENEINISNIRRIRLDLEEEGANRFPVMVDLIPGSNDLVGNTSFIYNGKPAYVTVRLNRSNSTNAIEFSVNTEITAGLASNQLNLRQASAFL